LLDSQSQLNGVSVSLFVKELEDSLSLFLTYSEHGAHQDKVLSLHPNLNPSMDSTSRTSEHDLLATMQIALAAMLQVLQDIKDILPEFSAHVLEHLRDEERTALSRWD
jgi:hypothetical protein